MHTATTGTQAGLLAVAIASACIALGSLWLNLRQEARRRRRAAERVVFTIQARQTYDPTLPLPNEALVTVLNSSEEVVIDVQIAVTAEPEVQASVRTAAGGNRVPYLLPGLEGNFRIGIRDHELNPFDRGLPLLPEWVHPTLRVMITWRDPSGGTWRRTNNGRPTRVGLISR